MKTILLPLLLLLALVGCSSHREPEKVAQAPEPLPVSAEGTTQYNNAISMIKQNPNFMENQKKEMIKIVDAYAAKSVKAKQEEANLRSQLMTEMLNAPEGKSKAIEQTRDKLSALNKQRTKDLEKFVNDFKFSAGSEARSHQFMMQEMVRTL